MMRRLVRFLDRHAAQIIIIALAAAVTVLAVAMYIVITQ